MLDFKIKRPIFKKAEYNILDFGAQSSCQVDNQLAIQRAIDYCHEHGGGKVIVPNGFYLTSPIELKSNVNLHLESNAFIKFTKIKSKYPLYFSNYEGTVRIRAKSPISAENCTNIAITGSGVIDGSGELWRGIKRWQLTELEWNNCLKKSKYVLKTDRNDIWCPSKTFYEGLIKGEPDYNDPNALKIASKHWDMYRPVLLNIVSCDKVLIEGVTLQNSPAWNVHPIFCTNVTIKDALIRNKFSAQNGDGIDLDSCQNCEIVNNVLQVGDDGICLKSGKNRSARNINFPTKNVWIHDCKVFNSHGGFVVGSEMSRGVENVYVEDCIFSGSNVGIRVKSAMGRGGYVRDIHIKNIHMADIDNEAIILSMKYVFNSVELPNDEKTIKLDEDDVPKFYNFYIDNVQCANSHVGLKIEGLKGYPIHDINITNSYIKCDKDKILHDCENINLTNVVFNTTKSTN